MHRARSPQYGRGTAAVTVDPGDPFALAERLRATFSSPNYHPPLLPTVALELHALSRKAQVGAAELVRVIETDPTVAALVLRRAQTAFYSGGIVIRSLREAVVRLGFRAVGDLFLEASMSARIFRAPGFEAPMERLRLHSAATAHLATLVARAAQVEDDNVFLAALMHDVGAAMGVVAVVEGGRRGALPPAEQLWPALYDVHESLAGILATHWKLPSEVGNAIARHHAPAAAAEHPLVACIAVGEALAAKIGFTAIGDPTPSLEVALRVLALEPGRMTSLLAEAERLAPTFR